MKHGTQHHLKMRRLKRLLGLDLWGAVGVMELLWLMCQDCCEDGDIGKFTDAEIADYLEWRGDPSELVRALAAAGWIDPDPARRYVIHDWLQECPEYIHDRLRKRRAREKRVNGHADNGENKGLTNGQTRNLAGLSGQSPERPAVAILSNQTLSNQTPPGTKCEEHDALGSFTGYGVAFSMAWESYPAKRRSKKTTACQAWKDAVEALKMRHGGSTAKAEDWLLQRILEYTKSPKASGRFCDGIKNWLVNGCYDDPAEAWQVAEDEPAQKPSMYSELSKPEDPEVSIAKRKRKHADMGANVSAPAAAR